MKGAGRMGKARYWAFVINPGVSYSPNLIHNITISVKRQRQLRAHQPEKKAGFLVSHHLQANRHGGVWVLTPESLENLQKGIETFKLPDNQDMHLPDFQEFKAAIENLLNRPSKN